MWARGQSGSSPGAGGVEAGGPRWVHWSAGWECAVPIAGDGTDPSIELTQLALEVPSGLGYLLSTPRPVVQGRKECSNKRPRSGTPASSVVVGGGSFGTHPQEEDWDFFFPRCHFGWGGSALPSAHGDPAVFFEGVDAMGPTCCPCPLCRWPSRCRPDSRCCRGCRPRRAGAVPGIVGRWTVPAGSLPKSHKGAVSGLGVLAPGRRQVRECCWKVLSRGSPVAVASSPVCIPDSPPPHAAGP